MTTGYQPAPIKPIAPHGGKLINRVVTGAEREELLRKASSLKRLRVNEWEVADIEIIAVGALSPLEGFMGPDEFESVVNDMHLPSGLPWTLPVTLSAPTEFSESVKEGEEIALESPTGQLLGTMEIRHKFRHNKSMEALKVYGTDELQHPGVAAIYHKGDYLLGGPITIADLPKHEDFLDHRLTPEQTREEFKNRGWRRIVAFQTRNPIHRAHEYMTKVALEVTDGLLLHPLVGKTKDDDVSPQLRMKCYEVLVEKYYPKDRVLLSVNPSAMRYAGPREAIFHAILRKNYGCTHFIVGRDHAGVGSYYGTFDAHYIFDYFDPAQIGITPLFFDYTFFCKKTGGMASNKTSPGTKEDWITLSGTKVRELLRAGELPPPEFTRPEVAQILIDGMATQESGAHI